MNPMILYDIIRFIYYSMIFMILYDSYDSYNTFLFIYYSMIPMMLYDFYDSYNTI